MIELNEENKEIMNNIFRSYLLKNEKNLKKNNVFPFILLGGCD